MSVRPEITEGRSESDDSITEMTKWSGRIDGKKWDDTFWNSSDRIARMGNVKTEICR